MGIALLLSGGVMTPPWSLVLGGRMIPFDWHPLRPAEPGVADSQGGGCIGGAADCAWALGIRPLSDAPAKAVAPVSASASKRDRRFSVMVCLGAWFMACFANAPGGRWVPFINSLRWSIGLKGEGHGAAHPTIGLATIAPPP
jgi:hypothetical protein